MEKAKKEEILKRIETEIEKMRDKQNKMLFYVFDTKGNPSGSLEYIYNIALLLKNSGYDVEMLYQTDGEDDEFVGVEEWLGEEYASLTHLNISKDEVKVSASDVLFIPEIFFNVMNQCKNLPCMKVAIMQNINFLVEQTPISAQWGDVGITHCICNTDNNAELIHRLFPYVRTFVVPHIVKPMFHDTIVPRKFLINIITRTQNVINKIIKPFYWSHPEFKWVSFTDLRGYSKERFAEELRKGTITIWVDEDTEFGLSALEAMKSQSIVIAKIPNKIPSWALTKEGQLTNGCLWFDEYETLPDKLASVIGAVLTDNVPKDVFESAKLVCENYTTEQAKDRIMHVIDLLSDIRINDMKSLAERTNDDNEEEKEEQHD